MMQVLGLGVTFIGLMLIHPRLKGGTKKARTDSLLKSERPNFEPVPNVACRSAQLGAPAGVEVGSTSHSETRPRDLQTPKRSDAPTRRYSERLGSARHASAPLGSRAELKVSFTNFRAGQQWPE